MLSGVPWSLAGHGVSSVGAPLKTPASPLAPSPQQEAREPQERFEASGIALPSGKAPFTETVEQSRSQTPQPGLLPQPTLDVVKAEQPSAPSPTGLILQEQPVLETPPGGGLNFSQLLRSASDAVGNTVKSWLGGDSLAELRHDLAHINELEAQAKLLRTPEQFAAKTASFKQRLANGESLESLRDEAYAVAREAASQTSGMRAFDCQMLGALAMNHGHVAEMRTGEGKTLTAVMPLYLNALAGKGAHLITVNETLAKRDSEWMGPVFEHLGMKVGLVLEDQTPEEKRANYNSDITYLTDRTMGFDYLRDQTALDPSQRVQRGHFFALVDEVDEVMIDEARTPMILSVKGEASSLDYKAFAAIVKTLRPGEDFEVDAEQTTVWLTEGGLRYVENELAAQDAEERLRLSRPDSPRALAAEQDLDRAQVLRPVLRQENQAKKAFDDAEAKKPNLLARVAGLSGDYDSAKVEQLETSWNEAKTAREALAPETPLNLYSEENFPRVHYLDACLKAQVLQVPGKDYAVENGEIKIIDQNKGRVSDGKRFSHGLHQALEAKEGLEVRAESRTAASITLPELFNSYQRKAGMTGTGKSSQSEFSHFYGLDVVEIPTNKPVIRKDQPDIVFSSTEQKFAAVVDEAVKSAQAGRPVLIGTLSVNANKAIAARLLESGFPSDRLQVLNAETVRSSQDVYEDNVGLSGTVTLATGSRADQIVVDPLNFKKMAQLAQSSIEQGQGVIVDVDNADDAQQMQAWVASMGPSEIVDGAVKSAASGQVVIRVAADGQSLAAVSGSTHISARDHRVEKIILDVDTGSLDFTVESALAAYKEGQPIILRCQSSHSLSACAERLLDAGLGLDSIPLVCDGKEKENLLVERAGRAGFITVATNMAGRGADIKPDPVHYEKLAEMAYDAASSGQGVVMDFEKESQALKVLRRLDPHCQVVVADKPDQKALPGQVLLRHGRELPAADKDSQQIVAADHKLHGLYVIGTERSDSRRIDDQLIGRAGRQGAEGESRFFLSLEDDLLRLAPSNPVQGLVSAMGGDKAGVSSPIVNGQIAQVQKSGEDERAESRCKSDKLEEVMRTQRGAYFQFREEIVNDQSAVRETVADFAATGLHGRLQDQLGDKSRYDTPRALEAARQLGQSLGVPLDLKLDSTSSVTREALEMAVQSAVSKALGECTVSDKDLKAALLYTADQGWQRHLESMDELRDGVNLEATAGRKPEEAYAHRGFAAYEEMVSNLHLKLGTEVLPQLLRRA